MSGIAVIFHRNGAPVSRAALTAMTAAMGTRAVDGIRYEIDGSIGVGFCSMATTPEAAREGQPLRRGSTLLAFDGRLEAFEIIHADAPEEVDLEVQQLAYADDPGDVLRSQ